VVVPNVSVRRCEHVLKHRYGFERGHNISGILFFMVVFFFLESFSHIPFYTCFFIFSPLSFICHDGIDFWFLNGDVTVLIKKLFKNIFSSEFRKQQSEKHFPFIYVGVYTYIISHDVTDARQHISTDPSKYVLFMGKAQTKFFFGTRTADTSVIRD